jgi:hypothetical protein
LLLLLFFINRAAKITNVFIFERVKQSIFRRGILVLCVVLAAFICHAQQPIVSEKGNTKNGLKNGVWYYYDAKHLLVKKEKWKNGLLKWQLFYNAKGKVTHSIDEQGNISKRPDCGC